MTITLAEKFMPILDEIYQKESLTSRLDALTKPIDTANANEVQIYKTTLVGMGTYSRSTGYPAGDVAGAWETIKLEQERGRAFSIDRMDNEETLGMAFGTLAGEFVRTKVVPEVDAYRFAKWASASGVGAATPAALSTAAAVLAAVDVASAALDAAEVPSEGRLLYVATGIYRLLNAAISRSLGNEAVADRRLKTLDDMTIIPVPQGRFYTAIDLNAGATSSAGGFAKGSGAKDLNFILLHPSARDQATKLANLKVFSPEQNQTADAWLFQYRLYHDAWVYDNKVKGIYVHAKNS